MGMKTHMTRKEFLQQFPIGSPYTAELADFLIERYVFAGRSDDRWFLLNEALHRPMAADVNGVLRGTTVRAAFQRAAKLDEVARDEWCKMMGEGK